MSWEQSLVGAVLKNPIHMEQANIIRPADLTGTHATAWREILLLHQNDSLDRSSFSSTMQDHNLLQSFGEMEGSVVGRDYVEQLIRDAGDNVEHYINKVLEKSIRRQLYNNAALVMSAANDQKQDVQTVLDRTIDNFMSIRKDRHGGALPMSELLRSYIPRLQGKRSGEIQPAWTPAVEAVRRVLPHVEESDFMVVAGRPGDGKSSYMRYEFYKAALSNQPALMVNLENGEMEYAKYLVAQHTNINSSRLDTPSQLSEREMARVVEAMEQLQHSQLTILTMPGPSIQHIDRTIKPIIAKENIKLIGLDYLQLVHNGLPNREQDVTRSSQGLRAMSLRYKVPVISAAQLSRKIEYRAVGSEPQLSDLRESGSIEQDATIVMFIRNEWTSPTEAERSTFAENLMPQSRRLRSQVLAVPVRFYLRKNRNGPTGRSDPVKFVKSTGDFVTL